MKYLPVLFVLAACGTSVGTAPVQPSFVMETKITRTSPEAKGMIIEVKPSDSQSEGK